MRKPERILTAATAVLCLAAAARAGGLVELAKPSSGRGVAPVTLPRFTTERGTPAVFHDGFFRPNLLDAKVVFSRGELPALPPSAMVGDGYFRNQTPVPLAPGASGLSRAPIILAAKTEELAAPIKAAGAPSGSDEEAMLAGRKMVDVLIESLSSGNSREIAAAKTAASLAEAYSRASNASEGSYALAPFASGRGASNGFTPAGLAGSGVRAAASADAAPGSGRGADAYGRGVGTAETSSSFRGVALIVMTVLDRGLVISCASAGLGYAERLTRRNASSFGGLQGAGGVSSTAAGSSPALKAARPSGSQGESLEPFAAARDFPGYWSVSLSPRSSNAEWFSFGESARVRRPAASVDLYGGRYWPSERPFSLDVSRALSVLLVLPLLGAAALAVRLQTQ